MTPSQARSEVERLITTLLEFSLAIDVGPALLLTSGGESIVTWSNDVELSSLFDVTSTLHEYTETLEKRWFSAVLFDGALLQLSFTYRGDDLVKHRLSYFPCPIYFSETELQQLTILELLDILETDEFRNRLRIEGPLRFDYDRDAGSANHAPIHFTISRSTCRVPVSYPLSLGHFIRFIFEHFYPDHWRNIGELKNWPCSPWNLQLPTLHDDQIYLHWRRDG